MRLLPALVGECRKSKLTLTVTCFLLQRMRKLQYVRELHVELNSLHARTEQQRATLNLVLNGVWQPMTLSRLQLERLLSPHAQAQHPSKSSDPPPPPPPLSLHSLVSEWNDSLSQMHSMLRQFLESPSSSPVYLSGLDEAHRAVQSHLKEHTLKLSNLRSLSHHLRSALLPELESDLAALQRQLQAAGTYSGPILTPSTTTTSPSSHSHSRAPPMFGLLPPTPFHANDARTSLAVPQTPGGVENMQQAGDARIQFTPSNIVRQWHTHTHAREKHARARGAVAAAKSVCSWIFSLLTFCASRLAFCF